MGRKGWDAAAPYRQFLRSQRRPAPVKDTVGKIKKATFGADWISLKPRGTERSHTLDDCGYVNRESKLSIWLLQKADILTGYEQTIPFARRHRLN